MPVFEPLPGVLINSASRFPEGKSAPGRINTAAYSSFWKQGMAAPLPAIPACAVVVARRC
jgi:hypothetical protein